ncbi:unnamed protein product [Cyberlindnera jadinii]|uniref:Uncharacterized protein n=1 Tax=Cyberlindnera jadinii (strain ATCC 18201 / CBS 1600 / BCRC 20928 / JCM 3617 / NBRC 0987 / NRRL Y-1542) TaxID=983966 RepID=A0A0H5C1D5_CYBJN|nr:unnamed protein product [Cyberlindnera jadinii]
MSITSLKPIHLRLPPLSNTSVRNSYTVLHFSPSGLLIGSLFFKSPLTRGAVSPLRASPMGTFTRRAILFRMRRCDLL